MHPPRGAAQSPRGWSVSELDGRATSHARHPARTSHARRGGDEPVKPATAQAGLLAGDEVHVGEPGAQAWACGLVAAAADKRR
jgi:hypothetical protein